MVNQAILTTVEEFPYLDKKEPESAFLQPVVRQLLRGTVAQVPTEDNPTGIVPVDFEWMVGASAYLGKAVASFPEQSADLLAQCAVELGHFSGAVAAVVSVTRSLGGTGDHDLGSILLSRLSEELEASLLSAQSGRIKLLLRFFVALSAARVAQASDVAALLARLVGRAIETAERSQAMDYRLWQPYTDHLVLTALLALPWGGKRLLEDCPDALSSLLTQADRYESLRLCRFSQATAPYAAEPSGEPNTTNDGGGCSFLGELLGALRECEGRGWVVEGIPDYSTDESVLAAYEGQTPLPLPPALLALALPEAAPGLGVTGGTAVEEAAAMQAERFPPRGHLRLLPPTEAVEGRPAIERIITEEIIIDVLTRLDGERTACVRTLAKLPMPYSYGPALAEVLFGQLLCLPRPRLKPFAYLTVLVDLCKVPGLQFTRRISGVIRELFARMPSMDPEVMGRAADWHAYHLSNFDWTWPWDRWSHVLDRGPGDGRRRYCGLVMERMSRLAYRSKVQEAVCGRVQAMERLLQPRGEAMKLDEEDDDTPDSDRPILAAACEVQAEVDRKGPDGRQRANDLDALARVVGGEVGGRLGGDPKKILRALTLAVLRSGSKSFNFLMVRLETTRPLLEEWRAAAGGGEGDRVMLQAAWDFWQGNRQRTVMVFERLMALRLVSAESLVSFALSHPALYSTSEDGTHTLTLWEVLGVAAQKTSERTEDARGGVEGAKKELKKAEREFSRAERSYSEASAAKERGEAFVGRRPVDAALSDAERVMEQNRRRIAALTESLLQPDDGLEDALAEEAAFYAHTFGCLAAALPRAVAAEEERRRKEEERKKEATDEDLLAHDTDADMASDVEYVHAEPSKVVLGWTTALVRRFMRQAAPAVPAAREKMGGAGEALDRAFLI